MNPAGPAATLLGRRQVWAGIVLLISIYALVAAWWARPMLWSDSAAGFQVWDSMRAGAAWNCYIEPNPENIAQDRELFRTWWSPGQYMFAGLLTLTGLSLGASMVLVTFIGTLAGLAGCWWLFKAWEFSEPVVLTSVALIALGWHTSFLFGMFNGGEVALFAGFPWIAWAATRLAGRQGWLCVALPPLFLAGAFLKLSFPVVALALCAGLWLGRDGSPLRIDGRAGRLAAALGSGFVLFYALLWAGFLSHGPTPGTAGQVSFSWPLLVGFSSSGPLLATGAFGSLLARIAFFPGAPLLTGWDQLGGLLCALALPSAVLYALAWKMAPGARYRGMLLGFVCCYVAVFAWLYYRGASVSTDDRHFRPAALVLLPGLVQAFRLVRHDWLRLALAGLALLAVGYGLAGFVHRTLYIRGVNSVGPRGFTQNHLPHSASARLHALDLAAPVPGNHVFYVSSPEMALDFSRVRVIQTQAEQESPLRLRSHQYRGRVDNLLIIASAVTSPEQIAAILGSFSSYDPSAWRCHMEDGCRFFYQGDWLDSALHGPAALLPASAGQRP